MKFFVQGSIISLLLLVSNSAIAQCNVHDHGCSFHSIGSQSNHSGSQSVHHTRGIQLTPNIPNTANGLYGIVEWKNNTNGLSADVDIEGLLPDNAGAYVISDTSVFGRSPPSSSPFAGMPNASNRSVDTFRYQTTFQNNTATAIHSVDTNGSAPIPNPQPCIASGQSDSCEHIQIKGNVPTGIYEFAATNYDVFHLADPSTPEVKLYAGIIRGDPNSADYVSGEIVYDNQVGEITGALPNRGDRLPHLKVGFVNHDFKPHAEGVVLDNYQRSFIGKKKYANPYTVKKGDTLFTYQKVYRDRTGVNYQDTIGVNGEVTKTVNKGIAWKQKNADIKTNLVRKKTLPHVNPLFANSTHPFAVGYGSNQKIQFPAYTSQYDLIPSGGVGINPGDKRNFMKVPSVDGFYNSYSESIASTSWKAIGNSKTVNNVIGGKKLLKSSSLFLKNIVPQMPNILADEILKKQLNFPLGILKGTAEDLAFNAFVIQPLGAKYGENSIEVRSTEATYNIAPIVTSLIKKSPLLSTPSAVYDTGKTGYAIYEVGNATDNANESINNLSRMNNRKIYESLLTGNKAVATEVINNDIANHVNANERNLSFGVIFSNPFDSRKQIDISVKRIEDLINFKHILNEIK